MSNEKELGFCTFKGEELYLMGDLKDGGALAYKDHVDLQGELVVGWMTDSFAHLGSDGNVRRYHEIIGTSKDLIFAKKEQ